MTDMSTEDMKASVAQVWRATYEESGLSIPASFPRVFSVLL